MSNTYNKIISIIDNRLKVFKDSLKFDKTYFGKVVEVSNSKAGVQINGIDYTARIKHGIDISVGDVVIVKCMNCDMSQIYVDGKLL